MNLVLQIDMPSLKEILCVDRRLMELIGLKSGNFLSFWAYGKDQTRSEPSTFHSVQARMQRQGIMAFEQHNGRRYELKYEVS
jgi:hypothetical protein